MTWLKRGTHVRITNVPDNVTDDVKNCVGAIGYITGYSDSQNGHSGYYVAFAKLPTKRFYANEFVVVSDITRQWWQDQNGITF